MRSISGSAIGRRALTAAFVALVVVGSGSPADARGSGSDDPAEAEIAGEYISAVAVSEVIVEGPGPHDEDTASRDLGAPGQVEVTDDGRIVAPGRDPVTYQRDGATITYSREFPDDVSCVDEVTGEVLSTGPSFGEYTLTVIDVEDGVATRLAVRSEIYRPFPANPAGDTPESNCGKGNADRTVYTGEWVRVTGASAIAGSEDGALTVAVLAEADPIEVEAGDEVSVPITVTGVRLSLDNPCGPVPAPFDQELILDSVVLVTSGSGDLVATSDEPSTGRGATVDVGSPLAVTTDAPGPCSYRQVAELVATVMVPRGTAAGEYPLVPMITGLPALTSTSASELAITVIEPEPVATPPAPETVEVETEFVANVGDVGNRSALAALLFAAAAAMFSRMRSRRTRLIGIFAGTVSLGAGAIELVAGGLLGDVDVGRHLASGAFSMATGMAVVGAFGFFLPWLSRPDRDEREAGPAIPIALGVWVFALRAMDGASIGRAAVAGVVALVIGLIAVLGRSRTRARAFGLVAGIALMVLTYLGAVVGDDSGTSGSVEAVIGLALAGVAVLIAVLVPNQPRDGAEPGDLEGPVDPEHETVPPQV